MKYANEVLALWYMSMCSYIVITNPEAHVEFIGINAVVFGLYKWMAAREEARYAQVNSAIRSQSV